MITARGWLGIVLAATLATGGCFGAGAPAPSPVRADAQDAVARARSAFQDRAWSSAARAFGDAADAYAALGEDGAEAALRREQAESLRRAGEPGAARAADRRALLLDRHAGRRDGEARDLAGLARSAAALGEVALAVASAREALALVPATSRLAAVIENDLALYLLERNAPGDEVAIWSLLYSALASNQARDDALGVATSELNLGRAALVLDDPAAAAPRLARARDGFTALEDPQGLARTHELLARLAALQGETVGFRFHLEQARASYRFLDDRAGLARVAELEATLP